MNQCLLRLLRKLQCIDNAKIYVAPAALKIWQMVENISVAVQPQPPNLPYCTPIYVANFKWNA